MQRILLVGLAIAMIGSGLCVFLLAGGLGIVYVSGNVLPGVSAGGVELGSKSENAAAAALTAAWNTSGVTLRDGDRVWSASPAESGIILDAAATAQAARAWGRADGGLPGGMRAMLSGVDIEPVLSVDLSLLTNYLTSVSPRIEIPAQDASIQLVNGQAVARPASEGRAVDIPATVERMRRDAASELADGALDLVMIATYPAVTDVTPVVAQANALLTSPFTVNGYDPIRDEWTTWTAPPEVWAGWLTAQADPTSPTGLALALHTEGARTFLQANAQFADERYIEADEAITALQNALAQQNMAVTVRVWHGDTTYTVGSGQTLAAIGEDVGMPYPYIQAANPGINADALTVGQSLIIPSKDVLVPLDPPPGKRIIISRSQQHLWAYENGQIKFDWVISTGLPSSPTALGTFQIQTHELNAYGDQWNLYMPHFMGFYHPGPNVTLMNGFHGFPTRGGGYLLWSGDLGHPVTYGCVLLSLENAETLYNWAENGVVVEVRA